MRIGDWSSDVCSSDLMLLTALALVQRDGAGRVAGLVGIAAAPDFTDWGFSDAEKAIIQAEGALVEETPYSDQPYVTTRGFFQSGEANRLLDTRSEEHTSELQSLMRTSYAVFCLKKKTIMLK